MPLRPLNREQAWLLPPTLAELIPDDHPARFVAAFVDALNWGAWIELGIGLDGEPLGAPAYHPRALLGVWLYGFMTGTRSCRKLEAACRDQVPYLWLTGWQRPDHNTLWRFYQEHRKAMRHLFKRTVRIAVKVGLVDLAIQAVDGTKVVANASKEQTHDAAEMKRLLERTEEAIRDLEAQNVAGQDPAPARLPKELTRKQALHQKVKHALERLEAEDGQQQTNLTDEDATLVKSRQGIVAGYNAQTVVSPLVQGKVQGNGMLITAADVVNTASDSGQLVPMLEQAEEITGERSSIALADGGYHTAANLEAGERRGQMLVMGERYQGAVHNPYFKDRFAYDPATDSYLCPQGHRLPFRGLRRSNGSRPGPFRVYCASRTACRSCPALGVCTKDKHAGRALWIGPSDVLLRQHRQWMKTPEAHGLYARRKELSEPTFGILKDQMGARRFLLRGLANVRAEFALLATAFNLRTLWRVWNKAREITKVGMRQQRLSLLEYVENFACTFPMTSAGRTVQQ
jgi:transposase